MCNASRFPNSLHAAEILLPLHKRCKPRIASWKFIKDNSYSIITTDYELSFWPANCSNCIPPGGRFAHPILDSCRECLKMNVTLPQQQRDVWSEPWGMRRLGTEVAVTEQIESPSAEHYKISNNAGLLCWSPIDSFVFGRRVREWEATARHVPLFDHSAYSCSGEHSDHRSAPSWRCGFECLHSSPDKLACRHDEHRQQWRNRCHNLAVNRSLLKDSVNLFHSQLTSREPPIETFRNLPPVWFVM